MSDLQVVREQKIGFDEHGNSANSDEVYVKVLASFQEVLSALKGARLHTFMCVATQEAKIVLGLGSALSLSSIQGIIGYSRNTVIDALDHLVENRFLDELPERESTGEKLYRVASYAWYGKPRFDPMSKTEPCQKKFPRVVGTSLNENKEETTTATTSRKILHQVGVFASHLPEIEPERATRWAQFIKSAPRDVWRKPAGFCFATLKENPEAEPPMLGGLSEASWLTEAREKGWVNR